MKSIPKLFVSFPSVLSIFCILLLAQSLNGQGTGTIAGRVSDATSGITLEGAIVTVEGTDLRAVSGRGGRYLLEGVPTGEATLRFSYLGLEDLTVAMNVTSGANAFDAGMQGQVYQLEEFLVTGSIVGQARALNLQRSSATLSSIVAADAIGRFPDQNAAEALNRLPGVSVERDQGEGRFVVVRGIDPNLNSVALDGVKLASPSTGERATLLDTIPTDTLQSIEVFKSVLPSQPGDSVGGYINIRTPSAFDDDGNFGRLGIQGNYSDLAGDWRGKVTGAYGAKFNNDTMGWMINGSYEERSFGSDNNEAEPWFEEDGGDASSGYVTDEIAYREYDLTRKRTGISTSLEFKPAADAYYFVRGSWNEYQDTEIRHQGIFEKMEDFRDITADSFVADSAALVREMKDRTEEMRLMAASAGGENRIGQLGVAYRISYSKAEEDTPFDFETVYAFDGDLGLRFTQTDGSNPRIEQISGDSLTDTSLYAFDGIELANQLVEETDWSGDVHFNLEFEEASLIERIEFGGLFRNKEKDSDLEVMKEDDNPAQVDDISGFVYASPRDPYGTGLPYVSPDYTGFFRDNRAAFALERDDVDSIIEDFVSEEDVYAGFFMATFNLSDWQLIAGVRVEHTRFSTSGFEYNDDTESVQAVAASNNYTNVLPGLHLRRNFGEDLVFRASANQTISRPNFEQTIPNAQIEGDEVTVGNPLLDPLESLNFDVSIEYYMRPLGVFTAAAFYKDVDNFIYEQLSERDYPGIPDAQVTSFRNGPSGEILGLELGYQRNLNFLPGPFDGFSIYANLTWIDSEATVLGPEEGDDSRKVPFIKQSDWIANIALAYEKYGFFARLAYSFRDDYLDEVGEEPLEDRYMTSYGQLDLSTSYQINNNLSIYANWINITDEPLHAQWGDSRRLSQFEEYGWSINGGIKYTF